MWFFCIRHNRLNCNDIAITCKSTGKLQQNSGNYQDSVYDLQYRKAWRTCVHVSHPFQEKCAAISLQLCSTRHNSRVTHGILFKTRGDLAVTTWIPWVSPGRVGYLYYRLKGKNNLQCVMDMAIDDSRDMLQDVMERFASCNPQKVIKSYTTCNYLEKWESV